MVRRRSAGPVIATILALLGAWGLVLPAEAQDQSTRPLGPPEATPLASPPAVPSGDGTGVRLHTALGDIVIGLFTESSPVAAENFLNLAEAGFYDGTVFHRVAPDFVIQGGAPTGTGAGDAGYSIQDEQVVGEYGRGIVAMARTQQPNSQGSQFFIVLDDSARAVLDAARTYAIFGRVVEGMDVVDAIAAAPRSGERPVEPVAIESTTVEQVVLPPEPSSAPPVTDDELGQRLVLSVSGQLLQPQSITGTGLVQAFGADDPLTSGLQAIAEDLGATLADVSVAVAGVDLSSGQKLDITALRVHGVDAASLVTPFAALITGDDTLTATPATFAGKNVQSLTGSGQDVPITAYVVDDSVLLIKTADEAARDEVLGQLP
jgi:peptidyl-prolyl cis-trans isomerase B (cyclophilin B)